MENTYRIIVTGSRDWENKSCVWDAIDEVWGKLSIDCTFIVVHGDCPTGADRFADELCSLWTEWAVERHPADWDSYGRAAGPIRNQRMVDLGADMVLAFIKNRSRGATGCARMALEAGLPLRVWTE